VSGAQPISGVLRFAGGQADPKRGSFRHLGGIVLRQAFHEARLRCWRKLKVRSRQVGEACAQLRARPLRTSLSSQGGTMSRPFLHRAAGAASLAILRRPWASRLAIAWGIRRAFRSLPRASRRMTFLGGIGLGAGLMFLLRGSGSAPAGARRGRGETSRAPISRRPNATASRRATGGRPAGAKPRAR
jgi:hypothetical protein